MSAADDYLRGVTGLTEDVTAFLSDGLASVERSLGPLLASRLKATHDDAIARCRQEEREAGIFADIVSDLMELEDQLDEERRG